MTASQSAADAGVPPGDARVRGFLPHEVRRRSPLAVALSILLHVAIIMLLVRAGLQRAEFRGNPITDLLQQAGGGGGGGRGGTQFVMLAPPPPPPPPPEQVAVPVVTPTVLPPLEESTELKPPAPTPPVDSLPAGGQSAGTGGGSGGGAGTGTGPGTGSGVGPGSGGGSGGGTGGGGRQGSPPVTKFMMVPPLDGVPKSLRGKTIELTFQIDATGKVTSLEYPPLPDRGYARKFDEVMRSYTFTPARDADGRAVAGVLTVTVTFPER